LPVRGGAVWQLVGLITRRSQVRILPPLPIFIEGPAGPFFVSSAMAGDPWRRLDGVMK
jgi:hypothetical protein